MKLIENDSHNKQTGPGVIMAQKKSLSAFFVLMTNKCPKK